MPANVEMFYATPSLTTLYFIVKQAGKVFNGTAFETQDSTHWSTYKIGLTDPQNIRYYQGTVPSAVPVGTVSLYAYNQLGGSPLDTDDPVGEQLDAYWDGTTLGVNGVTTTQLATALAPLFPASVKAATSTSITLADSDATDAQTANAAGRPQWVLITSGPGVWQYRQLGTLSSTQTYAVAAWDASSTPTTSSTYNLYSPDVATAASVITQMTAAATTPASADPATWTFPQMVAMLKKRFFNKVTKTVSSDGLTGDIVVKDDDGTTTISTLPLTVSGLVQTQSKSS